MIMCGDLDGDSQLDDSIFDQFIKLASLYSARPSADIEEASLAIGTGPQRSAYMQSLFHDALLRAASDTAATESGMRADAMAAQAVVFARLAGMLAGQLPPSADMYRSCMEAFQDGHGELERRIAAQTDHHHHHHGDGHQHHHHHHSHEH